MIYKTPVKKIQKATIEMDVNNGVFYIHSPYEMRTLCSSSGGKWVQNKKAWMFSLTPSVVEIVKEKFQDNIILTPAFELVVRNRINLEKEIMAIREEAEKNTNIDFMVDGLELNGKNPLYNYQRHGVICASKASDGFLIGDSPGAGKTLQALGTALLRKQRGEIRNCLIICPASIKYNWEGEIKKFTGESVIVIDGDKEEREKRWIADGYFFKVANYECVMNDLFYEINKKKEKQRPDKRISCADFILNNYFSMIAVDEIHYAKSHDSLRTKALKSFKCKYRLGLTGTPIDGRLEELHSIFEFLKPGLFPSKSRFMEKYAIHDYWGAVKGYKNIDEVKHKIRPFYVRRLKENVIDDLPDKIYIDLRVKLDPKAQKDYDKIAKRKHEITEESAAIEAIIRCRQFCDFPELLKLRHASDKFAVLLNTLEDLVKGNNEKVIIFTQYTQTMNLLKRNLEDEYDLSFIYGEIPSKERFEIVQDFNKNPKRQILIMTDAGAEGLNLQGANNLIHYDDNYSPAKMIQRNGRIDRIGQKKAIRIYRFICKDTIEERVRELLEKKQTVNNSILDEECDDLSLAPSTMDILGCL